MPKLAANLSMLFNECSLLDRFERAASLGFRQVEVQFPYATPTHDLAQALRATGLKLVLINAPAGERSAGESGLAIEGGRRFEDAIRLAMDYASATHCERLHVMIGIDPLEAGGSAYRRTVENLGWAADQFATIGVSMMIEALNSRDRPGYALPTLQKADQLRRDAGRPNIYLQFDVYHAAMNGDDPIALLPTYLGATGHVQIAGPPDRGEPDTAAAHAFLAALDAHGYQGYVGCEYVPRSDTEAGLIWAARYGIGPRSMSSTVP